MTKLLPIAFLVLVACAPANARQHSGARMLAQLEKADANNDGVVSKQEFTTFRAKQFSRIDRNNDGSLTEDDIPRMARNRLPPDMSLESLKASFDSNGDNKVSHSEFINGPSVMFERADADKNGLVTATELQTARTAFALGQ